MIIDSIEMKIPKHVAIILDGNGRWAKKRLMPRNYGHSMGAKNVEKICEDAYHLGIKYLTVYAFSTENWKRPQDEVNALMKLLSNYLKDCIKKADKNDMVIRVIGDKSVLTEDMRDKINSLEEATKKNNGLNFTIAINYGGRDEILRAVKTIMQDYMDNKIAKEELDDKLFSLYLDTKEIPDPDLLIRTSGEERISNFLLWQMAYTEYYFTDILWPDFDKEELIKAILKYNSKDRRFGKIREENDDF